MFQVIGLAAGYDGEQLFRDATFGLAPGERVGVVGPNGVGKSTLVRALAGLAAPSAGTVRVAPGTRVGYFAQQVPDPAATVGEYLSAARGPLPELSRRLEALTTRLAHDEAAVAEYAAVEERFAQLGGWAYQARVDAVRDRLGIDAIDQERRLVTLSGGEQARVMLAQVLLGEPSVLLLDEPTNHLDADGLDWLGGYLAAFPGAVLIVTHDRAMLDRVATRIVELDGIHLEPQFYEGNYTAYRAGKQHRWQRLLLDYEAQEKFRERLAEDIERTRGQALRVEQTVRSGMGADKLRRYAKKVARKAKARERRLLRQMRSTAWLARPETRPVLALAFEPVVGEGEPVIKASNLAVPGRLGAVDLTVHAGDRVLVTGANGAGKTTLLTALADGYHGVAVLARAALLPQTHDRLRLDTTVVEYFRSLVPMYLDDAEQTLTAYLFDADQQRQPLRTLSAGELRRLLLAAMVNSGTEVLLLDEPTNFLDFDSLDVVEEALREFRGTILMVTHDRYFASAVGTTRTWRLDAGRLTEEAAR